MIKKGLSHQGKKFLLDSEEIHLISGAIHYFRVVPEYWKDRLARLKACGFNCVEIYVPWNLHEPEEGVYNFQGIADLGRFLHLAKEMGIYVIIRPSPYICAEWEFGGLPYWLLRYEGMRLRCSHELFLDKVARYYDRLVPVFRPYLYENGGTIIACQIENEYGSYGNDREYLRRSRVLLEERGVHTYFFTSDGPTDLMLQGGTLEDSLMTVNFGSGTETAFKKLEEYQREKPEMCMEFWIGWFDHWGNKRTTRDCQSMMEEFKLMLARGASVNFYMFIGGTNFGFYNGANYDKRYLPTQTSYDYDALLREDGRITEKYLAVREVMKERLGELPEIPEDLPRKSYGRVEMQEYASLFKNLETLGRKHTSPTPVPMEKLGQDYGFILYKTFITGPKEKGDLVIDELHDRALIFFNGKYIKTVERFGDMEIKLSIPEKGGELLILVENMGRINYGPKLGEYKGITNHVRLERQLLFNWETWTLPLKDISGLAFSEEITEAPGFYRGFFEAEEAADTFIEFGHWKKGVIYVNGYNLGRYWENGPQRTLYLPGPILKKGKNEVVMFELHDVRECKRDIELKDEMNLG